MGLFNTDSIEKKRSHYSLLEEMMNESGTDNTELENILIYSKARLLVIGCGGAGNNTINRCMSNKFDDNVKLVALNTDAQHLFRIKAEKKILIGKKLTGGRGAGANPLIGRDAAYESEDDLRSIIEGQDMVFITCGLGGGTGGGSAPVIAQFTKAQGALTLAIVSYPFQSEGKHRISNANYSLDELRKFTDTVIVIPNDKLLDIVPQLSLSQAFMVADEILMRSIYGITDLLNETELVNVDFADLRTIMGDGDVAMIGIGEASGENKAIDAVNEALNSPLLEVNIETSKNALVNVVGGEDMTIKDAQDVIQEVQDRIHPKANIIWGSGIRSNLENTIRVMLVITGVKSKQIYGPKSNYKSNVKDEFESPLDWV